MKQSLSSYFARNIATVVAVVLVWRGIWELLDKLDFVLFGGSHVVTALGGIVLGLCMLYFPDRDLKEISSK